MCSSDLAYFVEVLCLMLQAWRHPGCCLSYLVQALFLRCVDLRIKFTEDFLQLSPYQANKHCLSYLVQVLFLQCVDLRIKFNEDFLQLSPYQANEHSKVMPDDALLFSTQHDKKW